jgi:ligand-binding sensor domain-containing protein
MSIKYLRTKMAISGYPPIMGLSRYNVNGSGEGVHRITNYSTDHGLSGNYVEDMLEDSRGNLWFATENGICRYNAGAET